MRIAFTHNLKKEAGEREAEFDDPKTIEAIASALRRLDHEVILVDVDCPVAELVKRLEEVKPDLVFNTAEGHTGKTREAFYVGLFEQMGLLSTGSDAHACTVTLDKRLTKLVVRGRGVPTPRSRFVTRLEDLDGIDLGFPLIVKPNYEGSSKGIDALSVVDDDVRMRSVVGVLLERYPDGLLCEEFIDGIDVTVPWLEGVAPEFDGALTPAGYVLPSHAVEGRAIYDYDSKNEQSDAVEVRVPAPLPPSLLARLRHASAEVARCLGLRDVCRSDFRVSPDGSFYFLEVNALPSLEPGASLYEAAALEGLDSVEAVLGAVVRSALSRKPGPPAKLPASLQEVFRVGLVHNLRRVELTTSDEEAEFDSPKTVNAVAAAIRAMGHEVVLLEADKDLPFKAREAEVEVFFNIAEGKNGRGREAQVPALADLLGLACTGSDAVCLGLTLDKALSREVVGRAGVPVPEGFVMRTGIEPLPPDLDYPVIVKPAWEGSSKGVDDSSVVDDEDGLREVANRIIGRYRQPALVETFLPGREFTVAVLGEHAEALRPMEIVFADDRERPVYGYNQKLSAEAGVTYKVPADVEPALEHELMRLAVAAHTALGCRDVSRVDLRLDADGHPRFIECNPLPGLSPGWSDLVLIGEGVGITYQELIARILAPALVRWRLAHQDDGAET